VCVYMHEERAHVVCDGGEWHDGKQGKHDELHDGTVQFLACKEQVADWGSGVHVYLEFFDLHHAAAQADAAGGAGGGGGGDGWAAVKERCGVLLTELEQADRKWGDGLQRGPCTAAGNPTHTRHRHALPLRRCRDEMCCRGVWRCRQPRNA
jgi:hypothetical protein